MFLLVKSKNDEIKILENFKERVHSSVIINKVLNENNYNFISDINEVIENGYYCFKKNKVYSVYYIEIQQDGYIFSGYKVKKHICDYYVCAYKIKKNLNKMLCKELKEFYDL